MKTKEEIRERHLYLNGLSVNRGEIGRAITKAALDAMQECAEAFHAEKARWIPVTERLPERFSPKETISRSFWVVRLFDCKTAHIPNYLIMSYI